MRSGRLVVRRTLPRQVALGKDTWLDEGVLSIDASGVGRLN